MKLELLDWMKDLSRYLDVGLEKVVYPRLGRGVDYRDPSYKDQARRVVERLHPREMKLRVVSVRDETQSTKTFRFERIDGVLPPFRAGQYVNLYVEVDGVRTSRPYSISSAPGAPGAEHLELTVRANPGGFVAPYLLGSLAEGDELVSSGPTGNFYHEPLAHGEDLVFLAGGSGVTPMMSMIRDQQRRGWPLRIQLLYGCRTPEDVIFGEELTRLAASTHRLSLQVVMSEPPAGYDGPSGFLDAACIREHVGDPEGKTFYVCGPTLMYDLCLEALGELGVPVRRIRRELYGPPADVTAEKGWPEGLRADATFEVEVEGVMVEGVKTFTTRAGEPLLNALERNHVVLPSLCRSGECSACRTRVLQGEVFVPTVEMVRESDRTGGYFHACVTYPLSDLKIRL